MKKIYTYLNISCAALIALILVSCGGGSKDYRNIIPSDSFLVLSVNPKSLAHKANVGDFTQSTFYKLIDQALGEEDMEADKRAYILSLISHPANTGLDMDNDAFMFMSGDDIQDGDVEGGLLLKVKNRKELDKFMEWVAVQSDGDLQKLEEGGITTYVDPDLWNTVAMSYTDHAFLLYFTQDEYSESKDAIAGLFSQKKSDSMMGLAHMENAFNGSNDMLLSINYGPVMEAMESEMAGMGLGTSMGWLSDMAILMPVNFEKGKIVSDAKIFFTNKDSEKEYEKISAMSGKLNGDFLKMMPEENIAVIAGNLKGAKVYEYFQSIPMYSMAFAMVPQLKPIMEAIDGDFALSFHGMDAEGRVPHVSLVAELKDPAIMETLMGLIPFPVAEDTPGHYSVNLGMGFGGYFGLNGKTLYITTSQGALPYLKGEETSSFGNNAGRVFNNSYGAMYFDITMLRNMLEVLVANRVVDREVAMALPFIGMFESWEVTGPSIDHADMVVNMTDKTKNSAEVLYKMFEGIAQMAMGFVF